MNSNDREFLRKFVKHHKDDPDIILGMLMDLKFKLKDAQENYDLFKTLVKKN